MTSIRLLSMLIESQIRFYWITVYYMLSRSGGFECGHAHRVGRKESETYEYEYEYVIAEPSFGRSNPQTRCHKIWPF